MRLAIYTNSISPHQLPLMRELARMSGAGNVLYAYESAESQGRRSLGWRQTPEPWCRKAGECMSDIEISDALLVGGMRPVELMEKRATVGLKTSYMSERWFKPPLGMLRLLHPRYFVMAVRFVKMFFRSRSLTYFPIGIHAARDMARLCGLMHGDLRCLFRAPRLDFERKPGGRISLEGECADGDAGSFGKKYCLDKMRLWGYFVAPAGNHALPVRQRRPGVRLRVLWAGRLLDLKRVDVLVRAVGEHADLKREDVSLPEIELDIYGAGPEEGKLKKLAAKYGECISFHPPVPIEDVRGLMRSHDVYVLASNGCEGWGAVVSEALEEGMKVLGTYEAGSSATMLPEEDLFHAGDVKTLSALLRRCASEKREGRLKGQGIGVWTAANAARAIIE